MARKPLTEQAMRESLQTKAIGQAMREIRQEQGMRQADLAKKLGLSVPMISKRERGDVRIMPPERKKLAKALGMTIDEFDDRWRGSVVTRSRGGMGIPLVNMAPAGVLGELDEYGTDSGQGYDYIDAGSINDELAFAVRVSGDSMTPAIHEDDILVFTPVNVPSPKATLKPGDVVFVRLGGDDSSDRGCTIARWHVSPDGRILLAKDNPAHSPLFPAREDITQLAVCVERRTKRV